MPMGSDKLYSGSADGSVRVWDYNSGKAWNIQTGTKLCLQGPSGLVCSMTINDEMLFAGTGDGRIMSCKFPAKESNLRPVAILSGHHRQVWDLKTLQCVQVLSDHKVAVTSVLCWDQKLLSSSLDKTVKVWSDSESGNLQVMHTHCEHGLHTLFVMHRVAKTPVLFCSLHNSNCIRLLDLPSFEQRGKLSSKKEVKTIELAAGGLLFTGDGASELKVWVWSPQDEEP